jgi:hypothetical protein
MGAAPTDAVLLVLAVWGAMADSRYKRNGGKKPTKQHKVLFLVTSALLVVPLLIAFGFVRNLLALGFVTLEAGILLFALWELGRWRVRRNNPASLL